LQPSARDCVALERHSAESRMLSPNPGTKLTASTPASDSELRSAGPRSLTAQARGAFTAMPSTVWHSQDRNEERVESLRSECAWLTMVCRFLECGLPFEPKNGHGRKRQNSTLRSTRNRGLNRN